MDPDDTGQHRLRQAARGAAARIQATEEAMTERASRPGQPDKPSEDEILESIRRIVLADDAKGVAGNGAAGNRVAGDGVAGDRDVPEAESSTMDVGGPIPASTTQPELEATAPDSPAGRDSSPGTEGRAGPAAAEAVDAGPGDPVLLLTDMIAPDGSVVRIGARPAETAPPDMPTAAGAGAGAGGAEGAGEEVLPAGAQSELAATVREWLDRNAPGLVDQAARREMQKLADRQD